jgi:precorrin-8X/cobalt-precorrin-8 methylmutase
MSLNYVKDGAAIYRESFATIRREADLSRFSPVLSRAVVRMIHACGMTDLPQSLSASENAGEIGRQALLDGAPILCDSEMLARGIIRARLPRNNEVICMLNDPRTLALAAELQTTRSAAAVELWRDRLDGAVVVIGNAPTALFHLLEIIEAGAPRPSLIVGIPVGFVGAAESKDALARNRMGVPFITVHGRRGGSAIAAAAINALSSEKE